MNIIIHRDDQDYGPYTLEQVRAHLAEGVLTESDLAWREGGSEWEPLKAILAMSIPVNKTPPPPGALPANPAAPAPVTGNAAPDFNRMVVMVVGFAGTIVLIALVGLSLVLMGFANSLGKLMPIGHVSVQSKGTVDFCEYSTQWNGEALSIVMKTDYAQERLRNKVMEAIYSVAVKNPSIPQLKVALHVIDQEATHDVVIEITDLAAVRQYPDKAAYEKSEYRTAIDAQLKAAGA